MNEYHGKGGTDILGLTGNPSGSWMITFPGDTYAKAAGASFCKAWSCVWLDTAAETPCQNFLSVLCNAEEAEPFCSYLIL